MRQHPLYAEWGVGGGVVLSTSLLTRPFYRCRMIRSTTTTTCRILKRIESKDAQSRILSGSSRQQQSNQHSTREIQRTAHGKPANRESEFFPRLFYRKQSGTPTTILSRVETENVETNLLPEQKWSRRPNDWLNYLEFVQTRYEIIDPSVYSSANNSCN